MIRFVQWLGEPLVCGGYNAHLVILLVCIFTLGACFGVLIGGRK